MTQRLFTPKRLAFLTLFILLVLVARRINFSSMIGAQAQYFTLFQFFGPIAGAFLGPLVGAVAVLTASLSDYLIFGSSFSLFDLLRLTPMVFAAIYFGTRKRGSKFTAVIPLICMALFIAHPVGRQAWLYSMYWLIPIAIKLVPKLDKLFFRSLGATFTAHAVGSVAFIYTIPMSPEAWLALIPIVAIERLAFSLGITGSFIGMNALLNTLVTRFNIKVPSYILHLNKRYTIN